jgi:ankyrin repeat protein
LFFLGYVEALEYLMPETISLATLIAEEKGKRLIERVEEALKVGAAVNDDTRNGHRPLQLALRSGQKEVARMLIECGADIDYRDRSGQTPIQVAINHGLFEIANFLIQKGVRFNPNAQNLGCDPQKLNQFQSQNTAD